MCRGASPPTCATPSGPRAAGFGGGGRSQHPQVGPRTLPRHPCGRRRPAGVAQGGADRHHLRLRLARGACRVRRPVARRLDRVRRRCGPHDGTERPAQPAGNVAAGHHRPRRPRVRRADLGQIEPRVLAAVSGDRAFAAATRADDLYAPVATALGVERPIAKVAVLAAMYGQRSVRQARLSRASSARTRPRWPTSTARMPRACAAHPCARSGGGRSPRPGPDTGLRRIPHRRADPRRASPRRPDQVSRRADQCSPRRADQCSPRRAD